ncbi:ATP-binding cassette domain-containing protein [Kocuria koreensis]|jgi:osmoprotectant transport system ATP-binding protein|uniref:ABC-type quaternary amine transporter n=1 Tax=Rothia koreensis TaxID=592378 RepID=A0A7K1LKX0_9MICC|nr:ABC transporter ATP-binding protein [Rothia koreensis]MUN55780.1 ATP-binding cassette domain-containing protein [Rothia koreensis]
MPLGKTDAIEFIGVSKEFESSTAVENLDLAIPDGLITVFVGPSGCGKTTSLRMINRMVEPTRGRILIQGEDNKDTPAHELRRSMGYVMQESGLMPHRTVADNIATVPRLNGVSKRDGRSRALELMDTVGLDRGLAKRYPAQLSGGQAQRVGVARALAADSPVLLMDEPFSAVDPVVRADLQRELIRLHETLERTIVFVTHDIDEAVTLGQRVAVFAEGGRVAQFGSPEEILREPADDFVASFVGHDRGTRRLTFASAGEVPIRPLDAEDRPWGDWRLALDDAGRPAGWSIDDRTMVGGSLFPQGGSLRDALDSVLSSPSGWGVAVDDDGRALGLLSSDDVMDAAARERKSRYGVGL